jgi:transposase
MACSKVISDFEDLAAGETGRQRNRTDAEKVRIVEESFRGLRQGSAKAHQYRIARSLLTRWPKEYQLSLLGSTAPAFAPVQIEAAPGLPRQPSKQVETVGMAEITLTNGRHLSVPVSIVPTIIAQPIRILDRQQPGQCLRVDRRGYT